MRVREIQPPFALPGSALAAWSEIQQEVGGIRGKGFTDHQIWQLAQAAEHTAQLKRGRLDPELIDHLKRIRSSFGLSDLPELPA